ncbi:hypothetical protein NC651_013675 [Populus alba x Populus x berolinensis]|nr:hypothetical protein NC651_013675 [Populus alba x Populus x berolinensis]
MFIAFERIFLYVILALQTIMISCKLSVVERNGGDYEDKANTFSERLSIRTSLRISPHVDLDVATYLAWGQPPLVVADGLFNGMDSFSVHNSSCM